MKVGTKVKWSEGSGTVIAEPGAGKSVIAVNTQTEKTPQPVVFSDDNLLTATEPTPAAVVAATLPA